MLALAYPDRVAQARGERRFRLRNGASAALPSGDSLVGEPFLVVADLDSPRTGLGPRRGRPEPGDDDLRIRLAAGLDRAEVEEAFADEVEETVTLGWDDGRDDLRQRSERRLGAIVLAAAEGPARPGEATTAALIDQVRATRLAVLGWRDADRSFQARVGFARQALGGDWPDLGDDALLASLDEWLAPRLGRRHGSA